MIGVSTAFISNISGYSSLLVSVAVSGTGVVSSLLVSVVVSGTGVVSGIVSSSMRLMLFRFWKIGGIVGNGIS